LVVDEYKKFEASAWIFDCATSNFMPSDAAVQSQFSWLSEDFLKGTVQLCTAKEHVLSCRHSF
jgi:hypothetical protein